jgi:hypothetical protein
MVHALWQSLPQAFERMGLYASAADFTLANLKMVLTTWIVLFRYRSLMSGGAVWAAPPINF